MQRNITKVSWENISAEVKLINPDFAKIVDKLSPEKKFYFYKASYPFGATIINKGLFHIPLESGEVVPINDHRVDPKLQADLTYPHNSLPVGMVLKNGYELFISASQCILPVLTAEPGSIIALWKKLDAEPIFHPTNIFNATAGARSIFMLPNVGNFMNHKNLVRDFNVNKQAQKNLLEQWHIFKTIAEHQNSNWRLEILFFPTKWVEQITMDPAWQELYISFLKFAWTSSSYERNQIFYEFALSCLQADRGLKPNPYLLDTVRHILSVTLGAVPAFKPAIDEQMAPVELIQRAYAESYRLKDQTPILMQPAHFHIHSPKCSPVYYSLQHPTTISFSPRSRQLTNILHDLRELKYIFNVFLEELDNGNVYLEDTIIDIIPQSIQYSYFHTKPDLREGIHLTTEMLSSDPNFSKTIYSNTKNNFVTNGIFGRGCIKIAHQDVS